MFGNPLTNQDLLTLAQASAEQKSAGLNLPEKYILATPISGYGFPAYRLFDAAYISTGIIDPNRLGTGSTGLGNLYLADDRTWKVISAGGGGDMLKATYDVDNDGIVDSAERIQILVRNSTGSTLTKGTVVYLSGATGNRPNAVKAQANTEATSSKTFGIVVANIANNADGYVACNGTLHDLDTSAFTAGDSVWLSAATAGAYTSTIPSEPNHTVFIGYIARSHPTQGRLVILIQNGYELNELHGVLISSEANNDLLVYETSTTLWKNKSISTIFGGTPLVSVPTLAQVTTAGNTTTNAITVGGLIVDTNTLVVDSVNDRVVIGATTATNKLEIFGTGTSGGVSSNVGYNIQPVVAPVITGVTYALQAGTALEIGTYYYRVTYYNAIGETNASNEILVTTTAGNRIVQLNNIPTSTDASVIGRKIYRNKVTDSSAYGVVIATLANNTTTTYTDSTPDTDPIFSGSVLTRPIYSKANTTARYIAVSGVRSMIVDPSLTTFGVNAGAAITVAPNVTLFGVNAGQNITYGGGNTLFGALAGSTITGGFENVAIGPYALHQVTTGSYNIGIGPFTNNRNNSHTIALGYYTGNSTTGDNNILIGGYIGSSTLAMTNSVIIGHNATPLAATNNQINIANTIYGRSNTGNVQIGTTTDAGYKLDVVGSVRLTNAAAQLILNNATYSELNYGASNYFRANGSSAVINGPSINFLTGGAERGRFVSTTGYFGLNTTTPAYRLDVQGTTVNDAISTDIGLNLNPVTNPSTGSVSLVASAGNVDLGIHYYWVSYTTAVGETGTYNIGNVTTVSGSQQVLLTIPVSSDYRVTGRKLHRTKANGNSYETYVITTIANNTATTYTDNIADSALTGVMSAGYYQINTTNQGISVSASNVMRIDRFATHFGINAGGSINGGGNNTLIGYNAGRFISTGNQNVGVGTVLGSLTTGGDNVAMGPSAAGGITVGAANIMIGRNAAANMNGNSNQNTIIGGYGWNAGTPSAKQGNTGLGYLVGSTNTGNYNLFLGYNAGYYVTGSNNILLDTILRADEATSKSAALIYGVTNATASSQTLSLGGGGNVMIGTITNAGYKLDVNGTVRFQDHLYFTNPSFTGTMSIRITANNQITFGNAGIGDWLQAVGSNRVFLFQELNSTSRGNVFGNTVGTTAVNISTLPAQSSGTANLIGLNLSYSINHTGTYVGIARGIYYNPTLTSLTGTTHRAIETVTGDVIFGSTSGNVAVGTTTAVAKLTVAGSITASSLLAQGVYFNNTLVAAANNDVLVGLDINPTFTNGAFTNVQNVALRVTSATPIVRLDSSAVGSFHGIEFRNTGSIDAEIKQLPSSGEFRISNGRSVGWGGFITFYTDTVERMRIRNNGNVLIGATADAGYKLDVNGTFRAQGSITATLASTSTASVVYYNSSTGLLTYGTAPIGAQFVIDYDPNITGTKNGVNLLFTTSATFIATTTRVFLNGQRLSRGATYDYVETGTNQITFAAAPLPTDQLIIEYQI